MKFVCSIELELWTKVWRNIYQIQSQIYQGYIQATHRKFISIGHKRTEIQRREFNKKIMKKKWILRHSNL